MTIGGYVVVTRYGSPWRGLSGGITVHGTPELAGAVARANQAPAANVGAGPLSVWPVELRILVPATP